MYTKKNDIEAWLIEHRVKDYTLEAHHQYGWIVGVNGDVLLENKNLKEIPVKFGRVEGHFNCQDNELKSWEWAPYYVGNSLLAWKNKFTNLKGISGFIGVDMDVHYNQISQLEHFPKYLGRECDLSSNLLVSLVGLPKVINGNLLCPGNKLTSLKGAPEHIKGTFDITSNELTNWMDGPKVIDFNFLSYANPLNSFLYIPEQVGGSIFLYHAKNEEEEDLVLDTVSGEKIVISKMPMEHIQLVQMREREMALLEKQRIDKNLNIVSAISMGRENKESHKI